MMTFNRADFYDAELRRHNERFRAVLAIGQRDRVLDIGCGAGQTTRDAAGFAVNGSVLGVDVSEELIGAARRRSAEAGLRNIAFELADAQVNTFPHAYFDLCISRFGVMFFSDPVAAFTNIGNAMRPGARLVLMVWQSRDRNEWATAIQGALNPGDIPFAHAPAAFSLADRAVTTRILAEAGFASIEFADVFEPVFYGPNVDAALDAVIELFARERLAARSAAADELLKRLRGLLETRATENGVLFGSRAWIVSGFRRSSRR